MIGHQHEGVEDPPRTMNGFVQPVDESLPVRIIANDVLPGVAPGHDVVNRISILDSKAATHESIGPKQQCPCKKKLINQSDPTGPSTRVSSSSPPTRAVRRYSACFVGEILKSGLGLRVLPARSATFMRGIPTGS